MAEIFVIPEITSRLTLYLDLESLLQLRQVNSVWKRLLNEYAPLLAQRDHLPPPKDFFHWALLFSSKEETRYSHWFAHKECMRVACDYNKQKEEELLALGELLENGQFEAVESLLAQQKIDASTVHGFLEIFGNNQTCLEWFSTYLAKLNDPELYTMVGCTLIDRGNPTLLAQLWRPAMANSRSKEEILVFLSRSCQVNLPFLYAVDTLYPRLDLLSTLTFEDIPQSWLLEQAKSPYLSGSVFGGILKESRLDLAELIVEWIKASVSHLPHFAHSCNSYSSLLWLAKHINLAKSDHSYLRLYSDFGEGSGSLMKRALQLHCSGTELETILETCKIEQLDLETCLYVFDKQAISAHAYEQLAVLLPLLKDLTMKLSTGQMLLLQHADQEKFNTLDMLTKRVLSLPELTWLLEKHALKVDWDKLVELYLYNRNIILEQAEIFSLLLVKDTEINGFAQGLPKRWIYDREKARERNKITIHPCGFTDTNWH